MENMMCKKIVEHEGTYIPFVLKCGCVLCMTCLVEFFVETEPPLSLGSPLSCPLCSKLFEENLICGLMDFLLPFLSIFSTEVKRREYVERIGMYPSSRPFLKIFKMAYEKSNDKLYCLQKINLSKAVCFDELTLTQRAHLIFWQIVCNNAPQKFRWRAMCEISRIATTNEVSDELLEDEELSKVFGHLSSMRDLRTKNFLNYITFNLIGIFSGTNRGPRPTLATEIVELKAVNKGLFEFPELKLFLTTKLRESSELLTPSLLDDFSLRDKMLSKLFRWGVSIEVIDLMRKKLPSSPPKCEVVSAEAKFKSRIKKELPFLNNDYLEKIWQIHKDTITVRIVS